MYATDVNSQVARNAIQAVGRIALRLPARANACVDKLLLLLNLRIDYITSETIAVMSSKQDAYGWCMYCSKAVRLVRFRPDQLLWEKRSCPDAHNQSTYVHAWF